MDIVILKSYYYRLSILQIPREGGQEMRSGFKPVRAISFFLIMAFCLLIPVEQAFCDDYNIYAASYTTYDTTYDDILKMYLKVMPAQCREQSRRRHDLYNDFMYADLSPYYMEGVMTQEYEKLDSAGKTAKRKELQEKTLQYMKNKVGYAILDVNGDGVDELIIGRDGSYIYELFTIDNGKVRELIKAGYRYSCHLLNDGGLFRFANDGGVYYGNILYRMNGTNKVEFEKGYYYNGQVGDDNNLGYECWFRISNPQQFSAVSMDQHVPTSEVNAWITEQESNCASIRFIPLSAYEKGMSGDGIAVLSLNGKTTGSQKIRIRKKPDSKSRILVEKKVGTYVKAVSMEGDYYQVTVDKKTGYVHKDYITLITELPAEAQNELE